MRSTIAVLFTLMILAAPLSAEHVEGILKPLRFRVPTPAPGEWGRPAAVLLRVSDRDSPRALSSVIGRHPPTV